MIRSYGQFYVDAHRGRREVRKTYVVKRVKSGWLVYEMYTKQLFEIFPTKLRAYYAATRLNGVDTSVVFNFGSAMFQKY